MCFVHYGRSVWVVVGTVWFYFSSSESIDVVSVIISSMVVGVCMLLTWIKRSLFYEKENDDGVVHLRREHLVASYLHSVSSLVLSCLVLVRDVSWKAPLTRTVSSWMPLELEGVSTTSSPLRDCSDTPCFISVKQVLIRDYKLPLIDLVVFAACVSASFHIAITFSDLGPKPILKTKNKSYCLNRSHCL